MQQLQKTFPVNKQKAVSVKEKESIIDNLLTIDELSQWLGVEKSTIYAWTSKKLIPHIKLGKKALRFRVSEILEWLAEKSVSPDPAENNHIKSHRRSSGKASASYDYVDKIIKEIKLDVLRN